MCACVFSNVCECSHLTCSLLSAQRQWATYEYSTLASPHLLQRGHSDQLVDRTPKEMKSDSLQLTRVVLMEPFKSRIAPVSENTANTPADVISQLLPQSEQVPPRLSEVSARRIPRNAQLLGEAQRAFWSPRVSAGPLVTRLPTSVSPKACWLKRARLNQHMLRLVMTPLPLLLLVYQCSLVLPSIFCPPQQSALPCSCWEVFPDVILIVPCPLCLASIFQRVYLSIFVWWHLLCGFHSSGCWLTPCFFFSPAPLCGLLIAQRVIMAWGTGSPAVSLLSSRVNSHFSPLLAEKGTTWPVHTRKRTSSYLVLTTRASETSAWLSSARVFVRVCECYCLRFPETLPEQNGQTPGTLFLSRPGQGKTC